MKVGAFITAALLLMPLTAIAQESAITGNKIQHHCKNSLNDESNKNVLMQGVCAGMINTIYFYGPILPDALMFCPPKGSTVGQALKIVVYYIDENPKYLHLDFRYLASAALRKAWPC